MIGNTLSFCIKEILDGKISEKDVECIRCGFKKPKSAKKFRQKTLKRYMKTYWAKSPIRGKRIAMRLFQARKLEFTGGHFLPAGFTWGNIPLWPMTKSHYEGDPEWEAYKKELGIE